MDVGRRGPNIGRRGAEDAVVGGDRRTERISDVGREQGTDAADRHDGGIRWGAIVAGVLATLTISLLLGLLLFGSGLVTAADRPGDAGNEDWVSGIIGLIAFFVGGYVAGISSRDRSARSGLLHGLLVWALGTVVVLALSALGIGQLFGALGDVVGQSRALGDPSTTIEPGRIADIIRSSALGAFFSGLVSAVAAALGGWLGEKADDDRSTDHTTVTGARR